MTSVRMEWTLDEFYADGGVVSFTDRVAAALGIHASTIKTVAVYEGSVVVQFFISPADNSDDPERELAGIKSDLSNQLESNSIDLGAPILDAITDGDIVIRGGQPADQWSGSSSNTRRPSTSSSASSAAVDTVKDFTESTQSHSEAIHETVTEIVYKERAEARDTGFKYPIIILSVLAAVLVALLMVVLVKTCCAKKPQKLEPNKLTQTDREDAPNALEPQFHPDEAENKENIFARNPVQKENQEDLQEGSVDPDNNWSSASKALGDRPSSTALKEDLPAISE